MTSLASVDEDEVGEGEGLLEAEQVTKRAPGARRPAEAAASDGRRTWRAPAKRGGGGPREPHSTWRAQRREPGSPWMGRETEAAAAMATLSPPSSLSHTMRTCSCRVKSVSFFRFFFAPRDFPFFPFFLFFFFSEIEQN